VDLHLGLITKGKRKRDTVERRLQNPGKGRPVRKARDAIPVIVGVWEEEKSIVLVAFDAYRRVGQGTRKSMFVKLPQLRQAAAVGWAVAENTNGESIYAFTPSMLATYIDMLRLGVGLSASEMAVLLAAAGVTNDEGGADPVERARRIASRLVRNAKFRRAVLTAYDEQCAVCGLNSKLVQGAHVYPVEASGSSDEVWNGLALCANHHAAFDRHLIWIDPHSRRVVIHPKLQAAAGENAACEMFVESTYHELRPTREGTFPRPAMLLRRYEYYDGMYAWATKRRRKTRPVTRRR
jgi:hypothetical protein